MYLKFSQISKESACFRVSLIKLQHSGHATLLKRYSNTCFPVKYAKFLRTPVLQNIPSGCFYPSVCMKMRKKKSFFEFFMVIANSRLIFFHSLLTGGGTSAILRHTQRNKKMLARDRIKHLVDGDYPMLEVGMFAGLGMEYGDICNAGLIVVIAKVSGELCIIGASDATVKGDNEAFVFVIVQNFTMTGAYGMRLSCFPI